MSERVQTGIEGLDELISGGFPRGRVILALGGPGTGKTILASQFLYEGITKYDENAIFVSLDESKEHFYSEMLKFGWDFKKAEEEGKFLFIDATRLSRIGKDCRTSTVDKLKNDAGSKRTRSEESPLPRNLQRSRF